MEQMQDTPPRRGAHHRRAQSETFFRFPDPDDDDDLLLLLDDFDLSLVDLPSLSAESTPLPTTTAAAAAADSDSSSVSKPKRSRHLGPTSNSSASPAHRHFRSLSVDADFFDGLVAGPTAAAAANTTPFEEKAADKLADLSLIDPKRAKRILANRQSAARSKERKVRYTSELERKVQTLQAEATTLSAQVTMMQRDASGLTIENKELKLRLQALEQQAHLRDALIDTLREEVNHLKLEAGQVPTNGSSFGRALPPQIPTHPTSFHHFNQQAQQARQQQLHMPHSTTSNNNQTRSGQLLQSSFADFNQRV